MNSKMKWTGLMVAVAAMVAIASPAGAAEKTEVPAKPTYSKDVAPILDANCVQCHREGDIAPMALTTYEEVRPWAKSILQNVGNRVMPPWHADPGYGPFKNERKLSDNEVATIVKWAETGAPQGNPADRPELPVFAVDGEWRLGEPDYVITFDETTVEAGGRDEFYNFEHKVDLPEDKWIKSIEIIPGSREVVHHVILWQQGGDQPQQGWLSAWAAGADPTIFPEKTGRMLYKNATIIGDMHYHPAEGETYTDATRVGLHFAEDEAVEKELVNLWVMNADFKIPAGDPNYQAKSEYTFEQDSIIMGLTPHLHYRGKDFKYTLYYPDGKEEELLKVSKYDFNWQTGYEFVEPIEVPEGARIECIAHWDNSADNPHNPDPTRDVTFGNESYDEMMIGFVDYIVKDGVRPVQKKSPVLPVLNKLAEKDPGQVFRADFPGQGPMAIHLPKEGEGGWYVDFNGIAGKARLYDIVWDGESFTCKMAIPGQPLQDLEGAIDREGEALNFAITTEDGQRQEGTAKMAQPE